MKGVSLEAFRVSVSSVPSSSSQGSGQDDNDAIGEVFMWGEGMGDGLLGGGVHRFGCVAGGKTDALLPKALRSTLVLDVQQISCGGRHAALITKQGEVFCWGEESGGRLGHGVDADVCYPHPVDALANNSIELVACGEYHTCAVTQFGELYTWGDGTYNFGLLGHGNDISHWIPKKVNGPLEGVRVSLIACGPWHTALVTGAGQLFTFGDGTFGALGHGNRANVSVPKEVESLKGLRTIGAACGVWHTAAIVEVMVGHSSASNCSSGKLFTWGDGDKGRLGHGDNEHKLLPTCVSALIDNNFRQVACGHSLTVALTTEGHVYSMGSTVCGQLGNPRADGKIPGRVGGKLFGVVVEEIACGAQHVAILTAKAEVYTWGKGANGRLGHGDVEDRSSPTQVEFLKDKQVKNIACGSSFMAAICLHKWVLGTEQTLCAGCRQPFTFTRKRHNCYNCGLVICHACSSKKVYKASMAPNPNKAYRVCDPCYVKLKNVAEPGAISHTIMTKKKWQHEMKDKEEKSETKISVPQYALSIIPGLQLDGRSQTRGGKKVDYSSSRVAPVPAGLLPWGETSISMSFDPMFELSSTLTSQSNILPSRKGLRSVSPFSRRPSPPRSTTPIPTLRGLTSPKTIIDDLKRTNDALSQEVLKLQTQVDSLLRQNQIRESEFLQSEKRVKIALAAAAEEAAKCKAAKEVIKSLTAQLKGMAERLPSGAYQNERPQTYTARHRPANGMHSSLALDVPLQATNGVHSTATSDESTLAEKEGTGLKKQKHVSISAHKSIKDVNMNGIARPYVALDKASQASGKTVGLQTKIRLIDTSSRDPSQRLEMVENGARDGTTISNHGQDAVREWVEQDESGVYITLTALPGGGKDLKRVRFSRKRFTEKQAEVWWIENRTRVFEQYNVQTIDRATSGASKKAKQRELDEKPSPNGAS